MKTPRSRSIVNRQRIAAQKPPKRAYTMSEAAVAQRRLNAPIALAAGALNGKSTGPITEEGKAAVSRNSWKHGRYSAANLQRFGLGASSISKMFGKPCLTTCPYHPDNAARREHPCSLVLDGLTRAGGSCLDKTVYVGALTALMDAMADGEMDGMHGVLAGEVASNLHIIDQIRQAVAEHGVMRPVYETNRDGDPVLDPRTGAPMVFDLKMNPALGALIMFQDKLGVNLSELMATPKARQRMADEDEGAGALQSAIGAIFAKAGRTLPAPKATS